MKLEILNRKIIPTNWTNKHFTCLYSYKWFKGWLVMYIVVLLISKHVCMLLDGFI